VEAWTLYGRRVNFDTALRRQRLRVRSICYPPGGSFLLGRGRARSSLELGGSVAGGSALVTTRSKAQGRNVTPPRDRWTSVWIRSRFPDDRAIIRAPVIADGDRNDGDK